MENSLQEQPRLMFQEEQQHQFGGGTPTYQQAQPVPQPATPPSPNPTNVAGDNTIAQANIAQQAQQKAAASASVFTNADASNQGGKKALLGG